MPPCSVVTPKPEKELGPNWDSAVPCAAGAAMIRSKLFRRVFWVVLLLVAANSVAFYALSVPLIERATYQQEEEAARNVLDSVCNFVQLAQDDIEKHRTSALEAHKRELKNLVLIQEAYIRSQMQRSKRGEIGEAQAKRETLEVLRTFRYGHNDYLWVSDYDSRLISHPDPKLHGADFSRITDIKGNLIVPPMVDIALKQREGYTRYFWRRLGEKEPVEKLTYSRHFDPWSWVIGTGVYIDDINREVKERTEQMIVQLRKLLQNMKLARTGYMYVFDAEQNMIVHPNPQLEGTNISTMMEPESGQPIGPLLMEAARRPGGVLHYKWDKPSDVENYAYDKISWVRHIDGFDWYVASSVYTDELKSNAQLVRERILAISVAILLVSLALSMGLVRWLLRPIGELSRMARRVQSGDLDAKNQIERDDEIGVLASAVNAMVDRLRDNIRDLDAKVAERTRELGDKNAKLRDSLEALRMSQEKVLASERRANEANRAKSTFLANMSHELRTPLNAIIGYSEMLEESAQEDGYEDAVPDLQKVQSAARHLLALINDILDISKIEAGKVELSFEVIPIAKSVHDVVSTVQPLADKKGNSLEVEVGEGIDTIEADPVRFRQVLYNLLSNACKFTSDGHVRLEAELADDERLRIRVEDSGIGMTSEQMERVFEPFVQGGQLHDAEVWWHWLGPGDHASALPTDGGRRLSSQR